MSSVVVKYRRPLNVEQLLVLRLLYFFRFGTVELITKYLAKSNIKVIQKKLKILEDQGFIAKHYDKTYKLAGRPAEYYLMPKGARQLLPRNNEVSISQQVTTQGIKVLYKNPNLSSDFIKHSINIFKIALHFKNTYGQNLTIIASTQMKPLDYLPKWSPDLYLILKSGANGKGASRYFFLDLWDGTRPFFVSVRKARSYITYSEEGEWPIDDADLPMILMISNSNKDDAKLRRQIRKALDENYEPIAYATSILSEVLASDSASDKIWQTVTEYSEDDDSYTLKLLHKSLSQSD